MQGVYTVCDKHGLQLNAEENYMANTKGGKSGPKQKGSSKDSDSKKDDSNKSSKGSEKSSSDMRSSSAKSK